MQPRAQEQLQSKWGSQHFSLFLPPPFSVCLLPRPSPPLSVILKISDRVLPSQKLQRPSIALTNKQVVIEWVGLELEQ